MVFANNSNSRQLIEILAVSFLSLYFLEPIHVRGGGDANSTQRGPERHGVQNRNLIAVWHMHYLLRHCAHLVKFSQFFLTFKSIFSS